MNTEQHDKAEVVAWDNFENTRWTHYDRMNKISKWHMLMLLSLALVFITFLGTGKIWSINMSIESINLSLSHWNLFEIYFLQLENSHSSETEYSCSKVIDNETIILGIDTKIRRNKNRRIFLSTLWRSLLFFLCQPPLLYRFSYLVHFFIGVVKSLRVVLLPGNS